MKGAADRDSRPQDTPALAGRLSAVSLFDLCQFLMLNRKTGTLTVRSEGRASYFTFQSGQLMSALNDAFTEGEPVVLEAVQWPDGSFHFDPGPVPPDRKIQASTENILLEAARAIDEMRAGAEGEEELPSQEESFRETQARAEGLAEAFRSAVTGSGSAALQGQWKSTVRDALKSGRAVHVILGPWDRAALTGPGGTERLDGIPQRDWWGWTKTVLAGEDGSSRSRTIGPYGRRTRFQGMTLHLRKRGGDGAGYVVVTRLQTEVPTWKELGLADAIYPQLSRPVRAPWIIIEESSSAGDAVDADQAAQGPHPVPVLGGHSLAAAAAWLRRRQEERPHMAWVVERSPRYDWLVLPGRVQSVHPERVRRPGDLSELCRATGAETLVLDRPWDLQMAREAGDLAAQGLPVAILDSLSSPSEWLRRRGTPQAEGRPSGLEAVAGIWSLRPGPQGPPYHSTITMPQPGK